jgi:plastocyanin
MRSILCFSALALPGALALLVGCSSSTTNNPPADAGASDTGSNPPSDAGTTDAADSALPSTNGCTAIEFAANDETAAGAARVVRVPADFTPVQFNPQCLRVKVGQTVTWSGDLTDHPLNISFVAADGTTSDGGISVTIGDADGGTSRDTVTAHVPGTLAVKCDVHPSIMFGAVEFVP